MKPTVLIVDDDESIRDILRTSLHERYRVVEASDGYYGLSEVMVGDQPVDLIITDLQMPGHNGVELIQDLPEDIPVIIISGYLHTSEYQKAMARLKPVAVFEKPFKISELCDILRETLGR